MEKDLEPKCEEGSRTETSSDESGSEFTISGFTKWRELRIANGADHYIWVGIEHDRKLSMGGQEFHFDVLQTFGAGYKRSQDEHRIVSRLPWKRIQFHWY